MKLKKGWTLIGLLVLCLQLVACGGSSGSSSSDNPVEPEPTEPEPTEPEPTEPEPVEPEEPVIIDAPSGLSLMEAGDQSLTIAWEDNSLASSYNVYYGPNSFESLNGNADNYALVDGAVMLTGQTSPLVISGLENDRPYFMAVTAVNSDGESLLSTEVVGSAEAPRSEATLSLNDTGVSFSGVDLSPYGNSDTCAVTDTTQDCHEGLSAGSNNDQDGFNFTKLDADGSVLADDAGGWSCVRDETTGLVWEVKNATGSRTALNTFNWFSENALANAGFEGVENDDGGICSGYEAGSSDSYCNTQAFSVRANQLQLCGLSNWRIPELDELRNIVHFGKAAPTILTSYFPNTQGQKYWTATPNVLFKDNAWVVDFNDGSASFLKKDTQAHIRLVSFGQ